MNDERKNVYGFSYQNRYYKIIPSGVNPHDVNGSFEKHFRFVIMSEEDELIGCINFCRDLIVGIGWNNEESDYLFSSDNENSYASLFEYLPNFSLSRLQSIYPACLHISLERSEGAHYADENKKLVIPIKDTFVKTGKHYMLADGSDNRIRWLVLNSLRYHETFNNGSYITFTKLASYIPVKTHVLDRIIGHLNDEKQVELASGGLIRITPSGRRQVNNPLQDSSSGIQQSYITNINYYNTIEAVNTVVNQGGSTVNGDIKQEANQDITKILAEFSKAIQGSKELSMTQKNDALNDLIILKSEANKSSLNIETIKSTVLSLQNLANATTVVGFAPTAIHYLNLILAHFGLPLVPNLPS